MSDQERKENFIMSHRDENSEMAGVQEEYYDIGDESFRKRPALSFIIAGVAGLVIIILLIVLLTRPSSETDLKQIQALEARIKHLEAKMTIVEGLDKVLARFRQQEKDIGLLSSRIQQLETNVTKQINQISQQLNIVEAKPSSAPSQAPPAAKPAPKVEAAKVHEVRRGETLYRISREYGLTVDQLRQYNNLARNAPIYPGQKLKLSPDAGN